MHAFSKYGFFVSTALAVGVGAPAGAWAQAAPASGPARSNATELQEVVVTATRKEEKLQNVPISITAFSQAQLTSHNITNAEDLANYTPSLSSTNFLSPTNTTFGLRGFEQDIGTQPAVGVYFADVVMPRGAANESTIGDGAGPGAFFDLENVQVLNGPQGTLFGRNTTGGAILLVPQKPTHAFGGYVETEFGDYAEERIQAVISLPLADTLAIRLGVDHQSRDGYLTNTTSVGTHTFDDIDYTAFRGSILWNVTPTIDNYTIVSYLDDTSTGDAQKLVRSSTPPFGALTAAELAAFPGRYTIDNTYSNPEDHEWQWQVINTTTWHASDDLTVKNIASFAELQLDLGSPVFAANMFTNPAVTAPVLAALFPPAVAPLAPFLAAAAAHQSPPVNFLESNPLPGGHSGYQSTMTEELQVQGHALDHKLDYTAGLYMEASLPLGDVGSLAASFLSCPGNGFNCANPTGLGGNSWTEARTDFHNYGAYAEGTYSFTDQWSLTGGVRYTWDREHVNGQLIAYQYAPFSSSAQPPTGFICTNPDAPASTCRQAFTQKADAPTGRVSVQYKPAPDVMLYAKYSRGYRAGGVTLQAPTGYQTFQPEHLNAYEAGAKTSFRSFIRGTFNAAFFYNDLANQQVIVGFAPKNGVFPPGETGILNVGASRIWGVELQGSIKPTDATRIDFGYTYLNTEATKVASISVPASSPYYASYNIRAGDQLLNSPEDKFTVTAAYDLPVPEMLGDMTVSATFNYSDPQLTNYTYRDSSGKPTGDSYIQRRHLLDLNFDWRHVGGSPVDLSVFASNVLNQYYWAYSATAPGIGDFAQIGPPRMYGVRLRYSFGR
jgi:iron complex outermembrane receptor protein